MPMRPTSFTAPMWGDPHDHGGKDDRGDQHLDELDESVAKRPHGGAGLREGKPEEDPGDDADEHLHVEGLEEGGRAHAVGTAL